MNKKSNKNSLPHDNIPFHQPSQKKLSENPSKIDHLHEYYFAPRYIVIPTANAAEIKLLLTNPQNETRNYHFEELPESFQTSIEQDRYHWKYPVFWDNTKLTLDIIFSTSNQPIAYFKVVDVETQKVRFASDTTNIQFDVPLGVAKISSGVSRYTTDFNDDPIKLTASWLVYTEQDFLATPEEKIKSSFQYAVDENGIFHRVDYIKD